LKVTTSGRVGGVIGLARHPSESWDRCPQALRLRHEIPAFAGMTPKLKSLHPPAHTATGLLWRLPQAKWPPLQ